MGSDGAGRPSERPRQRERKPLPRADSCLTSAAERASTAPQMAHARSSRHCDRSAQLGLGSQKMSRFRGVQVDLVNGPNICCRKPPDLYVSSATSARARNSKNGRVFATQTVWLPSSFASWGQIELQGVGLAFGRISKDPPLLRPPLLGRSIPLFFFKARVRKQMLELSLL